MTYFRTGTGTATTHTDAADDAIARERRAREQMVADSAAAHRQLATLADDNFAPSIAPTGESAEAAARRKMHEDSRAAHRGGKER